MSYIMNSKGFAPIIIVLVVAMALAFGGGVFYYAKKHAASQPSTLTQDTTTGWKTYRNEQYGFEFKYPSDSTVTVENTTQQSLDSCGTICNPQANFSSLAVHIRTGGQEIVLDANTLKEGVPSDTKETDLNFNGFEIKKMKGFFGNGVRPDMPGVYYTFTGGINHSYGSSDNFFSILLIPGNSLEQITDQILSTFKFT